MVADRARAASRSVLRETASSTTGIGRVRCRSLSSVATGMAWVPSSSELDLATGEVEVAVPVVGAACAGAVAGSGAATRSGSEVGEACCDAAALGTSWLACSGAAACSGPAGPVPGLARWGWAAAGAGSAPSGSRSVRSGSAVEAVGAAVGSAGTARRTVVSSLSAGTAAGDVDVWFSGCMTRSARVGRACVG